MLAAWSRRRHEGCRRAVAPMRWAPDAVVIDTTELDIAAA